MNDPGVARLLIRASHEGAMGIRELLAEQDAKFVSLRARSLHVLAGAFLFLRKADILGGRPCTDCLSHGNYLTAVNSGSDFR
ncbi:hypothetical protein QFZ94_003311 [Paraburkholderia sp. JPY465]